MFLGQLRAYDADGTNTLKKGLNFASDPNEVALAWKRASGDRLTVIRGEWY